MNTTIRTIICTASVMLSVASCQKSIEPVQPAEEGKETIDICVNGLMGEYTQVDGTKAELVNTVRVSWKGGETVYVYDGTQCLGTLKASREGTEDRYALLSTDDTHTVSTPASGTTTLTLVYSPLLTETPTVNAGEISVSLASQNGEKAPFVAYATLDYTGTTITDAVVPFKFATSVIKVNCTGLKPGTAISSATLINVNTACKLTLSGSDAPTVSGGTNGTITRTGDEYFAATKVNDEGEAVFQIAVPKLETASGARVLTVAQGSDEVKDKNFSKKAINPATSVNTVCQLVELPAGALKGEFSVSATKYVYFSQGNLYAKNEGTTESPDWKWHFYDKQYNFLAANMDVSGSTNYPQRSVGENETEIDLFTWGYSQATSLLPAGDAYVIAHTTTEDKQLVYDKASSMGGDDWGVAYCESNEIAVGTWRTLSKDEWKYLFKTRSNASSLYNCGVTVCGKTNCVVLLPDYWEWDKPTDEPKVGTEWQTEYPATSDDKVTWKKMEDAGAVCLPAAGYRDGSNVNLVSDNGVYWSSSANDYDKNDAHSVYFGYTWSDGFIVTPDSRGHRSYGFSVRLITE